MHQRYRTTKVGLDRLKRKQSHPPTEPPIEQPAYSEESLTKAASLIREKRRPKRRHHVSIQKG